jgi:solute carrier family 15 (oligopeptide transporter), member 1
MIVLVSKCIKGALKTRSKEKKTAPREHWLDYAEPVFGKRLVNETKILMNVLVLYIPLPIFWTLFDQQGSRWTFQATRMDGDIGFYEIKPDQMQVVNPFLILAFIPLYEALFYPLLAKMGIRRPLQKITLGGILAGVAFVCSGLVELQLEKTYPVIPSAGNAQLRVFNGMSCNYQVTTNVPDHASFTIASMQAFQERFVKVESQSSFTYNMQPSPASKFCTHF